MPASAWLVTTCSTSEPVTVLDTFTEPTHYLEDDSTRYALTAVEVIDIRAGLLDLDSQLEQAYDRYAFVRNAWLARREYKVTDGNVEDPALAEDAMLNAAPEPAKDAAPETPPPTQ